MSMAPSIRPSSTWSRGSKSNSGEVCADRLEHDVVVLAAGGRLVGRQVGDAHQTPSCHSSSAAAWAASAALTSAASVLVRASSSCFSSPWRLRDQLAELLLLGRAWSRSRAIAARRAASAARARSTTSSDSPRLAWAARTRSGSSRSSRGRSCGKAIGGTGCALIRDVGRARAGAAYCASPVRRRPEGSRVLDRPRVAALSLGRGRASVLFVAARRRGRPGLAARSATSTTAASGAAGLGGRPRTGCTPRCAGSSWSSARSAMTILTAVARGPAVRARATGGRRLHRRRDGRDLARDHRPQAAARARPAGVAGPRSTC